MPGVYLNIPFLTERDKNDLLFGIEQDVDYVAASFVRRAKDVVEMRKFLQENGGGYLKIISKIENQDGVQNIDEILEVSDGIMVARGDWESKFDGGCPSRSKGADRKGQRKIRPRNYGHTDAGLYDSQSKTD